MSSLTAIEWEWKSDFPQIPPPMWHSPTQTTTDLRSARPTQRRTRFRTRITTGTTTTATPTTPWTTWGPTWRSTTTQGGESEVFARSSKISEKNRWLPFLKGWLETFEEKRKGEPLHKAMNILEAIYTYWIHPYFFITHWHFNEMCYLHLRWHHHLILYVEYILCILKLNGESPCQKNYLKILLYFRLQP